MYLPLIVTAIRGFFFRVTTRIIIQNIKHKTINIYKNKNIFISLCLVSFKYLHKNINMFLCHNLQLLYIFNMIDMSIQRGIHYESTSTRNLS